MGCGGSCPRGHRAEASEASWIPRARAMTSADAAPTEAVTLSMNSLSAGLTITEDSMATATASMLATTASTGQCASPSPVQRPAAPRCSSKHSVPQPTPPSPPPPSPPRMPPPATDAGFLSPLDMLGVEVDCTPHDTLKASRASSQAGDPCGLYDSTPTDEMKYTTSTHCVGCVGPGQSLIPAPPAGMTQSARSPHTPLGEFFESSLWRNRKCTLATTPPWLQELSVYQQQEVSFSGSSSGQFTGASRTQHEASLSGQSSGPLTGTSAQSAGTPVLPPAPRLPTAGLHRKLGARQGPPYMLPPRRGCGYKGQAPALPYDGGVSQTAVSHESSSTRDLSTMQSTMHSTMHTSTHRSQASSSAAAAPSNPDGSTEWDLPHFSILHDSSGSPQVLSQDSLVRRAFNKIPFSNEVKNEGGVRAKAAAPNMPLLIDGAGGGAHAAPGACEDALDQWTVGPSTSPGTRIV